VKLSTLTVWMTAPQAQPCDGMACRHTNACARLLMWCPPHEVADQALQGGCTKRLVRKGAVVWYPCSRDVVAQRREQLVRRR
jgi:hypothetical protein